MQTTMRSSSLASHEEVRGPRNVGALTLLIGRKAFTARSIAGLIDGAGLLTKAGLPYLAEIFKDVENARNPNYRPKNPDVPFRNKPSADSPKYKKELKRRGLSRLNVPIKVVGVWDTVGSLGIPRIPWLESLHLQTRSTKEYLFYDTKLNNHILNAFQALALDEHRSSFSPALWEKPEGNTTNLRQVWFPGVHQNIGGGYADQEISNITLAWMMSQVDPYIDFHEDYILEQYDDTVDHYRDTDQKTRPWSFGKIYRSMIGIYLLGGRTMRTPGRYCEVDPVTGRSEGRPLVNTNEYIHSSIRTRIKLDGPGVEDEGHYDGHPLDDYKLRFTEGSRRTAIWQPRRGVDGKTLPESPLYRTERELLRESPRMYDYLLGDRRQSPDGARMSGALRGSPSETATSTALTRRPQESHR